MLFGQLRKLCSMKKYILIYMMLNLIFILFQIRYFVLACTHNATTLFKITFVLSVLIYVAALAIFIKHNDQSWNGFIIVQSTIISFTMIIIILIAVGVDINLGIFYFTSFPIIIIGVIGFYKNRDKINISFILWGVFSLVWASNLY
jgi:hypothetical protein